LALQTAGPATVLHFHSARSWRPWELESILAVPLVIAAALISALCYVFQLPSDLQAGWVSASPREHREQNFSTA
jgi:hypothetical protein